MLARIETPSRDETAPPTIRRMTSPAFTLRSFLADCERDDPRSVLRISERIALDYEATAIALELERRGRAWQSPVLWFDKVADYAMPVVTNVFATRRRYALAFGTTEEKLITEWAARGDRSIEPKLVDKGPVQEVVYKGADVDLARIPIKKHFERDAGRYITNGIIVAKDPETGVRNASFHALGQGRRAWAPACTRACATCGDYVKRAEGTEEGDPDRGGDRRTPDLHLRRPRKGPMTADEYAVCGGLMGRPMGDGELQDGVDGRPRRRRDRAGRPHPGRARAGGPVRRVHQLPLRALHRAGDRGHRDHPPRRTRCTRTSSAAWTSTAACSRAAGGAPDTARCAAHMSNVTAVSYPKPACGLFVPTCLQLPPPPKPPTVPFRKTPANPCLRRYGKPGGAEFPGSTRSARIADSMARLSAP